jgi:hypothetical protein
MHLSLILDGKPEGKRPLWRPRWRWEDNIKVNRFTWLSVGTYTQAVVNMIMNLLVA